MTEAKFYEKDGDVCHCTLCPHACKLPPGALGVCGARRNTGGKLWAESYGRLTAIALDPIEKKPLRMFDKGIILSIGSYGCNFHCAFCQNHSISFGKPEELSIHELVPRAVCELAAKYREDGNIGVAYTYNEPFISYEYVYDCARLVRERGLKNVLVTNGYVNARPLDTLLPFIDALNIDLKSYAAEFYKEIGGDIDVVKNTIAMAAGRAHVEVTTLVIPGENDTPEEMDALASWLAGIDPKIPLHITRFVPRHKLTSLEPTTTQTTARLQTVARRHLRHVFAF